MTLATRQTAPTETMTKGNCTIPMQNTRRTHQYLKNEPNAFTEFIFLNTPEQQCREMPLAIAFPPQRTLTIQDDLLCPAPDRTIDDQQNDGADNRTDKPGCRPCLIQAKRLAEKGCDDRASDAKDRGHDQPHALPAWMDELGHNTNKKTHNNRPDNMHCPSPFSMDNC